MAPTRDAEVIPFFIWLTCGQDVKVPFLMGETAILMECSPFNGSDPLTMEVYKDGEFIPGASFPYRIVGADSNDFGTYTFVLSTEGCGSDEAVSRILPEGQFLGFS